MVTTRGRDSSRGASDLGGEDNPTSMEIQDDLDNHCKEDNPNSMRIQDDLDNHYKKTSKQNW